MHIFNMLCSVYQKEEDSERHYIECDQIRENIDHSVALNQVDYENIYSSDIEDQIYISKVYDLIFKTSC